MNERKGRNMEATAARFRFEDARIVRVKELPKVCFLRIYVQAGKYHDYHEVVLFQPPSFPLEEGQAVTVSGDIQKKKPKDGGKEWTVEFIGRSVTKGDESRAPIPRGDSNPPLRPQTPPTHEPIAPDDDLLF
jgi:hypothetical protein